MYSFVLHDKEAVGGTEPVFCFAQVLFGKGCFLGVPVLMASAELDIEGLSGWELASSTLDET